MIIGQALHPVEVKDIHGLVCIDVWAPGKFFNTTLWDSNLNFDNIDSIIAANYELTLDRKFDLSTHNVLRKYFEIENNIDMILPLIKDTISTVEHRTAHSWLLNKFSSNSFRLLTAETMHTHVQALVPHIKNWLFLGGHWLRCTHTRPLSFPAIMPLPYNFYVATWSIQNQEKLITVDDLEKDKIVKYIDHGNGLYQIYNEYAKTSTQIKNN
jgi:hypothetical protein